MPFLDVGTTARKATPADWTGHRFGRWTARTLSDRRAAQRTLWHCVCDCGAEREVLTCHLVSGKSVSCGCYKDAVASARAFKHGFAGRNDGKLQASEYRIWSLMKGRCTNPKLPEFPRYGGRGIKVCDSWLASFESFYEDMGPRPSKQYTLDRIDNDGNYEPSNCRWATRKQQANNTSRNIYVNLYGHRMTMTQAIERYAPQLALKTAVDRFRKGQSAEAALGLL